MSSADPTAGTEPAFVDLPLGRIIVLPQLRAAPVTPQSVAELAAAILRSGVVDPPWVRKTSEGWVLVAGHRRLTAVGGLTARGLHSGRLRCLVVAGDHYDLQLAENTGRKNLNLLDLGRYASLQTARGRKSADLADAAGVSLRTIERALRVDRNLIDDWRDVAARVELPTTLLIQLSGLSAGEQEKELSRWLRNPGGKAARRDTRKARPQPVYMRRLELAQSNLSHLPPVVRQLLRWLTSRGARRPEYLPPE